MLETRFLVQINAKIKSCSVLRIGDEDDSVLLDKTTGKPLLPASSIAGSFRSYLALSGVNEEELKKLFGKTDGMGEKSRLFIKDAIGTSAEKEKRARVVIDNEIGSAKNKFDTLYLAAGNEFCLEFTIEARNTEERDVFSNYLYQCLAALHQKHIRFGAQKTNGAGIFSIIEVKRSSIDLYNKESYKKYLLKNMEMTSIIDEIKTLSLKDNYICMKVDAKFDTPILIGGLNSQENNSVQGSIKNKNGHYIPGSSLKGILRKQCERICSYFNISSDFVSEMFGCEGDEGQCGFVTLSDAKVNDTSDELVVYHQILIDRFTAGTIPGGKFASEPIKGSIAFQLWFQKNGIDDEVEKRNAKIGLLLFAIRDLLNGLVPVGSGYKIGRGKLLAKTVQVIDEDNHVRVEFGKQQQEFVQKYIDAFKNYRIE